MNKNIWRNIGNIEKGYLVNKNIEKYGYIEQNNVTSEGMEEDAPQENSYPCNDVDP